MDPKQYDKGRSHAQQLEHKIRDLLDDKNHPVGRKLLNEARRVEDNFQVKLNPRSIENHLKQFISSLEELMRYETAIINAQHARWLSSQYEDLQMSLRRFDNY